MRFLLITLLVLIMTACGTNNEPNPTPEPTPLPEPAPEPNPNPEPEPEPNPDPRPAAPSGSLDKTFSEDGLIILEPRGGDTDVRASRALEVRADGRIVTAINDVNANTDSFAVLAGLNADGSADETVGDGGFFFAEPFSSITDLVVDENAIHAVGNIAVETDGIDRLNCGFYLRLAVGDNINNQFCPGSPIETAEIATDSFGRLVTALLTTSVSSELELMLIRRNPDGNPDPEFGEFGTVTVPNSGIRDFLAGVVVLPDERILVLGDQPAQNSGEGIILLLFSAKGELEKTERLTLPELGEDIDEATFSASALTLDGEGRAVLAGQFAGQATVPPGGGDPTITKQPRAVLVRLDPVTFELDKTFGREGVVVREGSDTTSSLFIDLELDSEGRIIPVGAISSGTTSSFLVERYLADGSLDTSFGQNGQAPVLFDESKAVQAQALGVALANDGKIVVVGQVNTAVGLARLNP